MISFFYLLKLALEQTHIMKNVWPILGPYLHTFGLDDIDTLRECVWICLNSAAYPNYTAHFSFSLGPLTMPAFHEECFAMFGLRNPIQLHNYTYIEFFLQLGLMSQSSISEQLTKSLFSYFLLIGADIFLGPLQWLWFFLLAPGI